MKQRFSAALFDLDGVLVDTAKYHYLAWKQLANELGFDFTTEENEKLKGVSRIESLEILLKIGKKEFADEKKVELADLKNSYYLTYINSITSSELLPGSLACLEHLKGLGVKIALCSASKNAQLIIEKLRISQFFDSIVDGNLVTKTKPDPEIFLQAARIIQINTNNCVVFEDAEAGIKAAKDAGMFAIGIGKPSNLVQADIIVPDLSVLKMNSLFSTRSAKA